MMAIRNLYAASLVVILTSLPLHAFLPGSRHVSSPHIPGAISKPCDDRPFRTRLYALTTDSINQPSSKIQPTSRRRIRRTEKFMRLPVWPVWNGVFIWIVSKFAPDAAARLEDAITGRVCPNFYQYMDTSPFIMLVHHCHSFSPLDPLRFLQRTFFPEGFPSHPHRGFVTLTYFLHGGFLHRDSLGVQQTYGAEERHGGKSVQWLQTGAGLLHEEMFDNNGAGPIWEPVRQELYQLWINVPARHKLDAPLVRLLGDDENEIANVVDYDNEGRPASVTRVLAGIYRNARAAAPAQSKLSVLHVTLNPDTEWTFDLPLEFETALLYLRKGSVQVDGEMVAAHNTIYFERSGQSLILQSASNGADFMFLAGEPIREPCAARGSMVMTSDDEIQQAYRDYERGMFGAPWSHSLSSENWSAHVRQFPSFYAWSDDSEY